MVQAYSIEDFCKAHSICRSLFYKLVKQGNAPKVIKIGRRTLIPYQAAEEWLAGQPQATLGKIRY